jgi:hypothetical protein
MLSSSLVVRFSADNTLLSRVAIIAAWSLRSLMDCTSGGIGVLVAVGCAGVSVGEAGGCTAAKVITPVVAVGSTVTVGGVIRAVGVGVINANIPIKITSRMAITMRKY